MTLHARINHPIDGWQECEIIHYRSPKGYSEITDKVGHAFWQRCFHLRVNNVPGSIGTIPSHGDHAEVHSVSQHLIDVAGLRSLALTYLEEARGAEYNDWFVHLYEEFTDQFPEAFSIANTLYEMKHGIKEVLPEISDLRKSIGAAYLGTVFGYEAFIRDLVSCCNVYGKFKSRLKFLQENKEIIVDRKRERTTLAPRNTVLNEYELSWWPEPPPPPLPDDGLAVHHPMRTWFEGSEGTAKHYATAFINNQLKDLDNVSRQVDAMAGCAGLTNPVQILWNAIPWTWMCDWFIDCDSILTAFEKQPFEGTLKLEAAYVSSKYRVSGPAYTECQAGEPADGPPNEVMLRGYDRTEELSIDDSSLSPRLVQSSLTGNQLAITLALIESRNKATPDVVGFYNTWKRRGH